MGRGRGGSSSHEKRTPGGISTSSKMSKVGEIEAKHGVLGGNPGDEGSPERIVSERYRLARRAIEQEFIDELVNKALKREVAGTNSGREVTEQQLQDLLKTPKGRKFARTTEGFVRDFVLGTPDTKKQIDQRVAALQVPKEPENMVAAPDIGNLENYYLHSDRNASEINKKFREEQDVFYNHVFAEERDEPDSSSFEHNHDSEQEWYNRAGFLGRVYRRSLEDPSMRETFLKLWSLSGELEGKGADNASEKRLARERRVAGHLQKLWAGGHSIADESKDGLILSKDDELIRQPDQESIYDIYYYKMLLANPETHAMLQEAEDNKELISRRRVLWGEPSKEQQDISNKGQSDANDVKIAKQKISKLVVPMYGLGINAVDKIKTAVGQTPEPLPGYAKKALKGEPVSRNLFALLNFNDQEAMDAGFDINAVGRLDTETEKGFEAYKNVGLKPAEKRAMLEYTGSEYENINAYIRSLSTSFNNYGTTNDPDVKKVMLNRIYSMTHNMSRDRVMAVLLMRGMAKIIAARGDESKVLTRGSDQAPDTKMGFAEGKYFYDPGVTSSSLRTPWTSDWATSKTQYVLLTNKWVDARGFSLIDHDEDTPPDRKEEEMLIFPGTLFQADIVKKYKSTKEAAGRYAKPGRIIIDVVTGRQASVEPNKQVKTLSGVGIKDDGKEYSESPLIRDIVPVSTNGDAKEYSKRFSDVGNTLYDWLYNKKEN